MRQMVTIKPGASVCLDVSVQPESIFGSYTLFDKVIQPSMPHVGQVAGVAEMSSPSITVVKSSELWVL